MKINNLTYLPQTGSNKVDQNKEAQAAEQKPSGGSTEKAPSGGDSVELSTQAREVQQAVALAKAAPEVRAEKVAALKEKVASGEYQVDSMEVATKLVIDALARMT